MKINFSKKVISAIICCFVGMTGVNAEKIEPVIDSESEIQVSVSKSEWNDKGVLTLDFDVKNTSTERKKYKIFVDVLNDEGERIAGYSGGKNLNSGKDIPVKFSTSIEKEDFQNVKISVKDYNTKTIYVSTDGNDEGFGTITSPVKTLSKVISMIDGYDASGEYESVEAVFLDGEYDISSTQKINDIENLESITLRAEGENTVFSGGITIDSADMKKITASSALAMFPESSKNEIYCVSLSDYGYTADFKYDSAMGNPLYTALYKDGEVQKMSRFPEEGFYTATTSWSDATATGLSFTSDTKLPAWKYLDNAWVGGGFVYDWNFGYGSIGKVVNNKITVKYLTGSIAKDVLSVTKTGKKWFAVNIPEELDKPGEYVIYNNVLYYYPDGDLADSTLKLNTSENDMFSIFNCENVTIEGITFENSRGYFVNVGNNTKNINILGCTFRNNSENAVVVKGTNNYNNTVKSCDFYNIGARPITMGGGDRVTLTSSENILENCLFTDFNTIARTNCGAVALEGCGVEMRKNTISGAPHLAVSYGGNNHMIEYNDIYNCLTDGSGDAGIVYVGNNLSVLGTEFKNNYIHDSFSGMGAIYYDDRLSGQIAKHNVFENLDTVLFIHAGVCNNFSDNYVVNNTEKTYAVRVRGRYAEDYWMTASANSANHYLLRELVTLPWEGDVWQKAYRNVLKYVNTKTTENPSETVVDGNYFINVTDPVVLLQQGESNDITGTNYNSISAEKLSEYEQVKNSSGIYVDAYRLSK